MRACDTLFPIALLVTSSNALPSTGPFQALGTATSVLVPTVESIIQHNNHEKRLLRRYATENADADNKQGAEGADNEEERGNVATALGKADETWEDAVMRLAYQHWYDGGKSIDDVRLIMSVPEDSKNWGKYLKYLEFVKEKEQEAANAAKVAALKLKRTYRGWYIDGKTDKEVRHIFDLPPTGKAIDHLNWAKYEDYLAVVKEYSKIVY